jgi:hypothetical protein
VIETQQQMSTEQVLEHLNINMGKQEEEKLRFTGGMSTTAKNRKIRHTHNMGGGSYKAAKQFIGGNANLKF